MHRINFNNSLKELQQQILAMGGLVEEAIANSVKALATQNMELAQSVIDGDDKIDELELEIEDQCLKLIATQQPMAKDLRKISTGFKIIADLERMADNAVNISKVTKRLVVEPLIKPLIDIPRMAELVQKMVKNSLDAYVNEDIATARNLAGDDDKVDRLHAQIFRELIIVMMEDTKTIKQATQLIFVSRYLERIADLSTNIGEGVIYLVSAERHDLND